MKKILLTILLVIVAVIPGYTAQKTVTVGTSGSKASLDTNFGNIQDNTTELYEKVGYTGLSAAPTTAGQFPVSTAADAASWSTPTTVTVVTPLTYDPNTGQLGIDTSGLGGFTLDTFPEYSDSPHTSGIAVNATTLAVYSAEAGEWLTVGLTASLSPTPVLYTMTLTITDALTTGDTFSVAGTAYDYLDSPAEITGLSSAIQALTYTGSNTGTCTGSAVTGTSPDYVVDMSTSDQSVSCAVTNDNPEISDDFSSDTITSGAWIEDAGNWSVGSGVLSAPSATGWAWLRHYPTVSTISQYAKVTLTSIPTNSTMALFFRGEGSGGYRWVVRYDEPGGALKLGYCNGSGQIANSYTLASSLNLAPGDKIAATVQGTGTSSLLKVWINPTNAKPYSINNWDDASDAADYSHTLNSFGGTMDTGLSIGVVSVGISQTFDDFSGGSL